MNFSYLRLACNQRLLLLALFVALTGCATAASSPPSVRMSRQAQIDPVAARDLVYALAQAFPPKLTTVQIGPATSAFAQQLVNEIINTGFGVQRVSADQGPRHLYFTQMTLYETGVKARQQYRVHIGKTGFQRAYTHTDANEVVPASPLQAYGIGDKITLHPELFVLSVAGQQYQSVLYLDDSDTAFITTEPQTGNNAARQVAPEPARQPGAV